MGVIHESSLEFNDFVASPELSGASFTKLLSAVCRPAFGNWMAEFTNHWRPTCPVVPPGTLKFTFVRQLRVGVKRRMYTADVEFAPVEAQHELIQKSHSVGLIIYNVRKTRHGISGTPSNAIPWSHDPGRTLEAFV